MDPFGSDDYNTYSVNIEIEETWQELHGTVYEYFSSVVFRDNNDHLRYRREKTGKIVITLDDGLFVDSKDCVTVYWMRMSGNVEKQKMKPMLDGKLLVNASIDME